MQIRITSMLVTALLSLPLHAADRITSAEIEAVIQATDAAAQSRDAAGIGEYLGSAFRRILEFPYKDKWLAKVTVRKQQYLELLEEGWLLSSEYQYQRGDTEIHLDADGLTGMSHSTITETMQQDGAVMISRFREYATYEREQGRVVITEVTGHTLLGDTTPDWQQD